MLAGNKMKQKANTLIFIDEIQAYPHLLTLLKFLSQDDKFTFIASGSLLGVTLSQTTSIPMGSIRKVRMFPLDFEEFLYANGMNEITISAMHKKFERLEALDEPVHEKMITSFVQNEDYHIKKAFVLSNAREITTNGKITYLPIYMIMFFQNSAGRNGQF